MLPSETMIWQPEFTDKTLSRKPGAVHLAACPLLLDKITTIHRVKQVVTASLKLRDYDGQVGVVSENGIYGHSRFCNTDFDDKLACLNLSGV